MFFHEHDILVAFIRETGSVPLSRIAGRHVFEDHAHQDEGVRTGYFGADVSMQPPGGPPSRNMYFLRPPKPEFPRKRRRWRSSRGVTGIGKGEQERKETGTVAQQGARRRRRKPKVEAQPRGRRRGRRREKRTLSEEWDTIRLEIYSSGRNCFRDAHVGQVEGSRWYHLRSRDPLSKTVPHFAGPIVNEKHKWKSVAV